MKLVIGLGNPGERYAKTWHNAGFWALDAFANSLGVHWDDSKVERFKGVYSKAECEGQSLVLLKPMTFMNVSGESVGLVAQFFKVPSKDWVVIFDDIDLERAVVRLRVGGGHGGHNGVRSIIDVTGRSDFSRIKLGVGRPGAASAPDVPGQMGVADYVLQRVSDPTIKEFLEKTGPQFRQRLNDVLKA